VRARASRRQIPKDQFWND